jgi:transcriptional regulator with XRE-family HTH domain
MQTLGEKVQELRNGMDISMRELARRTGISSSFMAEIESGRRYPKEAYLAAIAKELGVKVGELRKLDTRSSLEDLKRLVDRDPAWGTAFNRISSAATDGTLTPAALIKKLGPAK